ncbi:MAG: hypothetical protein IJJ45_12410 [Clostridia bacterium]|nr:hypothetical protein [Clostridia bacterium]
MPGKRDLMRCATMLIALLLCAIPATAQAAFVVDADIAMADITGFDYTIDVPLAESFFLRYRFYTQDGDRLFYHESKQGGAWPLTEDDIVLSGTAALSDGEWAAFCDCLRGGTVSGPDDEVLDGDSGPWMELYWTGDERQYRGFAFASQSAQAGFEALCSKLSQNHVLTRFCLTRGGSMAPQSCEIFLGGEGWKIRKNGGDPRSFSAELAAELRQIVSDHDMGAWDGFHEKVPNVLDGEFFELELGFADGTAVRASGDNAFPDRYHDAVRRIEAMLDADTMSWTAGTYRYEGEGFGGDFTITLNADGTYTFYEGPLSSYQGGGIWSVHGDTVHMTEKNIPGPEFLFAIEGDALVYLAWGSSVFPYVEVSDADRFLRLDGSAEFPGQSSGEAGGPAS